MIKSKIKSLLASRPLAKAAALVLDDLCWGFRLFSGQIDTDSGTLHSQLSQEDSIDYIEEVFNDYKKYGGIEHFYGVAAEIGPGDNAGVALLMRQDGCEQVDLIDRFYSRRNPEQQSKIYANLAQRYRIDNFRIGSEWDEGRLAGITYKFGQSAEDFFQQQTQVSRPIYDFIVSRAVLEHLYDPLGALRDMVACLKPGGRLLHKIDLRDHCMFTPSQHELKFLEMPSPLYRLMVSNSGRPNRILFHRYREILENLKNAGLIDYYLLVTRLTYTGDISPHQAFEDIALDKQHQAVTFVESYRQKFAQEFQQVASQDLAISGFFLNVIKK